MSRIESALERALAPSLAGAPPKLAAALRYAVFPGGARVRPRLCLAVAEACGLEADNPRTKLALGTAAALELVHCASLVHDDLPCFDDADERRSKPSVHRAFSEPIAVLVGDALIINAFDSLSRSALDAQRTEQLPALVTTLATAIGSPKGLVAGQAWESEASAPLETYHRAKTSSLFVAAARGGALSAGADPEPWITLGERLGDAYQVADDLLDAHATRESAGKPTQQDGQLSRPNAVLRLGTEGALQRLKVLVQAAADAVPDCEGADCLRTLVIKMAAHLVPAGLRQSAA